MHILHIDSVAVGGLNQAVGQRVPVTRHRDHAENHAPVSE